MTLTWKTTNSIGVEGVGVERVFKGWAKQGLTDQEILTKGFECFDGRRGGGAHQGQGGDSVDDGDGGPDSGRIA